MRGVGGFAEVAFSANFRNLADSDSDEVSWVASAFRFVGFFRSCEASPGIAFFATGAFSGALSGVWLLRFSAMRLPGLYFWVFVLFVWALRAAWIWATRLC